MTKTRSSHIVHLSGTVPRCSHIATSASGSYSVNRKFSDHFGVSGQRGTMKDDPFLACLEVDQFLVKAVGIGAQDPAYAQQSGAAVHACRDRIAKDVIDVAAYNTTESVADVADLRTAMGINEWNIYALSYGTDLALQVLRDRPDGIRSVVLDSVLPPPANIAESGWEWAAHSYGAIFDACVADPACGQAFPDSRAEFTRMVGELSANPIGLTVDVGGTPTDVVIDGYKLASGVVVAYFLRPGHRRAARGELTSS